MCCEDETGFTAKERRTGLQIFSTFLAGEDRCDKSIQAELLQLLAAPGYRKAGTALQLPSKASEKNVSC